MNPQGSAAVKKAVTPKSTERADIFSSKSYRVHWQGSYLRHLMQLTGWQSHAGLMADPGQNSHLETPDVWPTAATTVLTASKSGIKNRHHGTGEVTQQLGTHAALAEVWSPVSRGTPQPPVTPDPRKSMFSSGFHGYQHPHAHTPSPHIYTELNVKNKS